MKYCTNCGNKIEKGNFCVKCGEKILNEESFDKKNLILNENSGNKKQKIVNLVLITIFISTLVMYFALQQTKEEKIISEQPEVLGSVEYGNSRVDMKNINVSVENGFITFPLSDLEKNKFVKFTVFNGRENVPLLAYINEDGKLVTSISMCEPCNSTSFHIKENDLICNSCGSTWNLNNLKAITGSCGKYPPDPIPSIVEGNNVKIPFSNISNWVKRI